MSFLAYFVANFYCLVLVPTARSVPQMVDPFNVEQEVARSGCVWKLQLAFVLLDLFETGAGQN
jgi:hypothetical protein